MTNIFLRFPNDFCLYRSPLDVSHTQTIILMYILFESTDIENKIPKEEKHPANAKVLKMTMDLKMFL